MKNISKLLLAAMASVSVVSCQDFLSQNSPSTVDADFVFSSYETAKTVMYGAYNTVVGSYNSGMPTNFDNIGSDVERCSVGIIADLVGAAQLYGGSTAYTVEQFNINGSLKGYWDTWYSGIAKANQVILNIKNLPEYEDIIKTAPNDWSDLLGQAYALRATLYRELTWHYGDVIYYTENELGQDIKELTNRDKVLESEIEALIAIEPLMYKVGEANHLPDQMTKNYVDGLIGRLCFQEAGYQTRRTDLGDDFYTNLKGEKINIEVWGTDAARNAAYGRRSDWKDFYSKALPYLKKGVEDPGQVVLTTVDPRSDKEGRTYGNPFQYYFDQVTKLVMPMESVFEFSQKEVGGGSRIAYNFGRGSNGGSTAYPPKSNAQTCSYPEVFYGMYDPQDLRRDASVNVTGSAGNGLEIMYTYALSNKVTLGIGANKYDLNRQENPDARQLYSGINYIMMRQADIILMYAEALAVTGDAAGAKTQLKKVHDRAFPAAVRDAKFNELLAANGNDVFKAIIDERKLEFNAENLRRWDLIRTGMLPENAVTYRKKLVDGIAEMKKNGYVQYANGNQFPAYIWTKMMDAKKILGYRLTATTPSGLDEMSDEYALTFPGYRGQHDNWLAVATEDGKASSISKDEKTNVAIKGLVKTYVPASAEVVCTADIKDKANNIILAKNTVLKTCTFSSYKDVLDLAKEMNKYKVKVDEKDVNVSWAANAPDGYTLTPWGALQYEKADGTADAVTEARWGSEYMCGYTDADYAAKKAPIYLVPMNETVCKTTGLTNGYGFRSTTK